MNKEKRRGTQFEIWLEKLFSALDFGNVVRDVHYSKEKGVYRQVDLSIHARSGDSFEHGLVEAKYSSAHPISYSFWGTPYVRNVPGGKIRLHNLVDQVKERELFVGADFSVLVTNRRFSNELYSRAKEADILLVDKTGLANYVTQLGSRYGAAWLERELYLTNDIDRAIKRVPLNEYDLSPNHVRVV